MSNHKRPHVYDNKRARIICTLQRDAAGVRHAHTAAIDEWGNGVTSEVAGHRHSVRWLEWGPPEGPGAIPGDTHRHDIARRAPDLAVDAAPAVG